MFTGARDFDRAEGAAEYEYKGEAGCGFGDETSDSASRQA